MCLRFLSGARCNSPIENEVVHITEKSIADYSAGSRCSNDVVQVLFPLNHSALLFWLDQFFPHGVIVTTSSFRLNSASLKTLEK